MTFALFGIYYLAPFLEVNRAIFHTTVEQGAKRMGVLVIFRPFKLPSLALSALLEPPVQLSFDPLPLFKCSEKKGH